jgi:glyoxylate reductase
MFCAARTAIFVRVSSEAEAMCGRSTTFSRVIRSGSTSGSRSKTSRPAPAMTPSRSASASARSPRALRSHIKIVNPDAKRNEHAARQPGATYVTLDELLAQSDFVSLHTPLLPETRHLMNAERLSKMKRTAILINSSRGPVVDERALAEALRDGVIAGAGLDVFEREPDVDPLLMTLENVVLLPHIASASEETRTKMAVRAAQNVLAFLDGKPLLDPVP